MEGLHFLQTPHKSGSRNLGTWHSTAQRFETAPTANLQSPLISQPSHPTTSPSLTVKMSDNGEVEVEAPAGNYAVLPKEVTSEIGSTKLFNKWSYEDVEIRDISLTYTSPNPANKEKENIHTDTNATATISKSALPSTCHTLLAATPPSGSAKHNAPSSSA